MESRNSGHTPDKQSPAFDDRNLPWHRLGDLEHFVFYVFDVDPERGVVDFILKFEPNQRIILHRHLALTNTFVVQGEHCLYEPNGALKEIRPVGSYTSSPPGEPHREGGGDQECVVFYSVRGKTDVLFELLDDNRNIVGTLTTRDFIDALEEQKKAA
jgi:quercetin dioxygenase-like cupin family protein